MAALPLPEAGFDLIWCEGAAYVVGIEAALGQWRRLLRPGGRIAFSEVVWLSEAPAERARAFWLAYPAMTDRAGVEAKVRAAGLRVLGSLPEAAWENYYGPLAARLERLVALYGPQAPALAEAREEMACGGRMAGTTATASSWWRLDRRRGRRAGRAGRSRPVADGDGGGAGRAAGADGALCVQSGDRAGAVGGVGAGAGGDPAALVADAVGKSTRGGGRGGTRWWSRWRRRFGEGTCRGGSSRR